MWIVWAVLGISYILLSWHCGEWWGRVRGVVGWGVTSISLYRWYFFGGVVSIEKYWYSYINWVEIDILASIKERWTSMCTTLIWMLWLLLHYDYYFYFLSKISIILCVYCCYMFSVVATKILMITIVAAKLCVLLHIMNSGG